MKTTPNKKQKDELVARSIALYNASAAYNMDLRELLKEGSCIDWSSGKFLSKESEKDVRELRDTIGRKKGKKLAQILKSKYQKRPGSEH